MLSRSISTFLALVLTAIAQQPAGSIQLPSHEPTLSTGHNDPAEMERFRDRGFGLFVHWGVDGPLAGVISHSLVGASGDYVDRYFRLLPGYFNPDLYEPGKIAALAKLAGFEYVMFTTKHHSGFCMWDTATTDFSVMHTPYGKDITRQLVDAFRKQGIAIGFYFSPDDFSWLHQHHITINRQVKGVYPQDIPEFMDYTKRQLKELLTNYGNDRLFFLRRARRSAHRLRVAAPTQTRDHARRDGNA